MSYNLSDIESKMRKTVDSLLQQFSKLRAGRAHPSLLDHLNVDYYGSMVPVSQIASVSVESAQTLLISPWEKSMTQVIEKAIQVSDLGLSPAVSGEVIRLSIPSLTEERRRELVKLAKEEAEKARVSVRAIRRDANNAAKASLKDKQITEDEAHDIEGDVQKLTNCFIDEVDEKLANKEKDLLSIAK